MLRNGASELQGRLRLHGYFFHWHPFADFFESQANLANRLAWGCEMDYQVDLDPTHSVIRLTVTAEIITMELAEDIYRHLSEVTARGGPYAAIYDLSGVKDTTIPTEMVRSYARRPPSIPIGKKHVVVGKEPGIFGLARIFQMCGESLGNLVEVVWSLEEAYDIVSARP